jgi:hypothetical protein
MHSVSTLASQDCRLTRRRQYARKFTSANENHVEEHGTYKLKNRMILTLLLLYMFRR